MSWPGIQADLGTNPSKLVTAEQMRELDRRATDDYGIPSLLLMENAGRAVAAAVLRLMPEARSGPVLVLAGPGNNGGDGFVAARHLHNQRMDVVIAYYGEPAKARGDALKNIEIAEKMGLDIRKAPLGDELSKLMSESGVVIDALLGTGLKGTVREPFASVIECLCECGGPVVAVDIPSGVDSDTGKELGTSVNAAVTVTFALPKVGLVTYPGREVAGKIHVADIGIPQQMLRASDCAAYLLEPEDVIDLSVGRSADSNKGDFGHVAIVAGSVGMTGAATLAALGALRTGAGLVTVTVPESLNDIMEAKLTEAMTIPVPEGKARAFGMASLGKVSEVIEKRDAAVIGPGFGRDPDTVEFTLQLLKKLKKPAIVDADALFAVSTDVDVLRKCKAPLVITPHPGEMARLLGTTAADVQSNRLEVARSFAKQYGITVVLKGAGTVVADPDEGAFINPTGTPAMATGGTGDVLSGMIGTLLAQTCWGPRAAKAAVYLHGRAGEMAGDRVGIGMLASDLADCIWPAIQHLYDRDS